MGPRACARVGRALSLPDGALLVPGPAGQRWIVRGTALEHAQTTIPDEIVAVLDAPEHTFEFVGNSGTIFRSKTPLGPVVDKRALGGTFDATAATSTAIVAVRDGKLFRSTDGGASYSEVSAVGREGRTERVVLSRDGRGLLLMLPQRLFATLDHGATWTRVPLTDGSSQLAIGDDGAPYLGTHRLQADGKALAAQASVPANDRWLWEDPGAPVEAIAMHGDTVVAVAGRASPRAAVAKLAEHRSYRSIPGLEKCDRIEAAAARDHVVIGCVTNGTIPAMRVARSYDAGATWKLSAPYAVHTADAARGAFVAGPNGALLFAGPRGATLIATEDTPAKVLFPDLGVLTAGRFDEAQNRILFATTDGHVTEMLSASLDGSDITSRGKFGSPCLRADIAVDAYGAARAACAIADTYTFWRAAEYLFALTLSPNNRVVDGNRWSAIAPEFSLGGDRSLVVDSGRLFEGMPGVQSLVPIGAAPEGPFACSAAGCAFPSASRIGWNSADSALKGFSLHSEDDVHTDIKRPALNLNCKVTNVTNSVSAFSFPDLTTGSNTAFKNITPTGFATATWTSPSLQTATLYSPAARTETIHQDLPNGFVSLRYRALDKPAGKPPLIAAEVAWQRIGTTKPKTFSLGTIGRFAIEEGTAGLPGDDWPWAAGIVDGGAIVRPTHPFLRAYATELNTKENDLGMEKLAAREEWTGTEPFYFVSDAGKITKILPPKQWVHRAIVYRGGSRWFVVSRHVNDDGTVRMDVSSDALGSSWERRQVRLWTKGRYTADYTPNEIDGRPAFAIVPEETNGSLLAIIATDGSHDVDVRGLRIPPIDLAHACMTIAGELARATLRSPFGFEETIAIAGGAKLGATHASLSIATNGEACVEALYALGGASDLRSLLIPMRDPKRSVYFGENDTRAAQCELVP